jgi:MazG family protein
MTKSIEEELKSLLKSVSDLRHPHTGCPWDLKQTQESLVPYIIEEAYEVSEAILQQDQKKICEELGDYLYQVLIQSQIAEEKGYFNFQDVMRSLNEKLIRRHPHVFSGEKVSSVEEVKKRWKEIKASEQSQIKETEAKLFFKKSSGVSPLKGAHIIGDLTQKIKFDWENWVQVSEKVKEEWKELQEELERSELDKKAVEHELGDLIFTLAQLARHLGLDSEVALQKTNLRFRNRFELMIKLSGLPFSEFNELPSELKEKWYQKAKRESVYQS